MADLVAEFDLSSLPSMQWDQRSLCHRAPASAYREIVTTLRAQKTPYLDKARNFSPHEFPLRQNIVPRSYQTEALAAWIEQDSRGVVCLPTGAGKTILAMLTIERIGRPTLIHVPTLDLMQQWHVQLQHFFGISVGLLGGGYHELLPITVTTYDSALIHINQTGNRYGFLIFDECHHLPSTQYQYTALAAIAPFRLGLSATPERTDGREEVLYQLCGKMCYQVHINDLEGNALAPYEVITLEIPMNAVERAEYEAERKIYVEFLKRHQIFFNQPKAWQKFLWQAHRSPEGRKAFQAYLQQKRLTLASSAKIQKVWELLREHPHDRILIFTQENDMAYRLGTKYLLPVLTHHTKIKEREFFLDAFRKGELRVLVTSKVLNEGVDVPEANVAIVVSGSGSIREHVQRLGRILRERPDKHAILYELISQKTSETYTNARRKQHRAYQKSASF